MENLIIIFLTSLVATISSSMSGGGASIISLPVFLWLGMPFPLAIAAHKFNAIFFTPISAYTYLKDRKVDWTFLLLFAAIGLIGSYLGVKLVVGLDKNLLNRIVGIIILAFVIFVYFKKEFGLKEKKETSVFKKVLSYFVAILMGFYESIFGSGNGIAFTALTYYTRGFDFIDALGYYFAIAFFWVSFASILYIREGYFDLGIMLSSTLGAVLGAYFGSKYAKYKGNKFIKTFFVIVGAILGIKLILNF